MNLVPVTSSNIAAVGHKDTALRVQFTNGSLYEYQNVPATLFQELLAAPSIGSFFASSIKSKPSIFPFKKVS